MSFLEINPCYQAFLEQEGLVAPRHFLEIPCVIICGHPDRHVARVTLGSGARAFPAYLKREHRVPWKDRLRNATAGFGFVSKSGREVQTLRSLQQAGIRCPDWIAVGEDEHGRAFLLLRELTDTKELRLFLRDYRCAPDDQRRRFARKLGEALANIHNAGFDHPDLYSKHVLVNPDDQSVSFLDWQRSRRPHRVAWRQRFRDLAALEATLADDLATVRDRLFCLRTYLQTSRLRGRKCKISIRSSALFIRRLADRLLRQRRIRELCKVPTAKETPRLIWLDGEALCLTPDFHAALAGKIPDWLPLASFPSQPERWETRTWVDLPEGRRALLMRRREKRLLDGLRTWLRRRPIASPELRRAGLLFRLERYGIHTPRLLAFGQRSVSWRRVESFLLVEPSAGALSLNEWLARGSADSGQRRQVIRDVGRLLRRVHDLHCYLGGQPCIAVVQPEPKGETTVVLASIDSLHSRQRPSTRRAWKDMAVLQSEQSSAACTRTDGLRLCLSYLGERNLSAAAKQLVSALLRSQGSAAASPGILAAPAGGGFGLRTAEQGAFP